MNKSDEPAFPSAWGTSEIATGLTKREYFAAQCLPFWAKAFNETEKAAEFCVRMADALIAALDKK